MRAGAIAASQSHEYPRRPCHLRARSDGHARYRADNHGHCPRPTGWLSLTRPARTHPVNMPDKDEVPGSSPGRPTPHRRRSQRSQHRARSARRRLGPRWGRTPHPRRHLQCPAGAAHPAVRLGDDHPPWSPPSPRTPATRPVQPPRAAACPSCPPRRRPRRAHRTPAWPTWSLSWSRAAAAAHNPTRRPGSATDLPLTNPTWAASPASRPPGPSIEPSTARQPPGPPPVLVVRVARPARPWSQRHRRSMEETDASGPTGQPPDGWTPEGWTADGWTLDGWTADGRPPDPLDDDPR
jgi:hypothetical protein